MTVLVKDWHWKSYLGIGMANKLTSLISAAKYRCCVFLRENGSLSESRPQGFLAFLVADYVCYIFVTVRETAFGEDYVFEFCGGTFSKVWQGKPRVAVALEKRIYRWYLGLVVKRLHCITCLNAWAANCATFWNQKLCCGTVFLNKNDETKNFSTLHVFCLGKTALI